MKQKLKDYLLKLNALVSTEIDDSVSAFNYLHLKKGDYFVKENVVCNHLGFVLEGGLRAFSTDADGQENVICFSFEDKFITSYDSFLFRKPSKKSIQAIEDCKLLIVDFNELNQLFLRNPSWQIVSKVLTEKEFLEKESFLIQFNNKSAKEKYAMLLKSNPEIIRRVQVEYIASYLGITQRTLNRVKREIVTSEF